MTSEGVAFYQNAQIYFATKHAKEELLAPLFLQNGLRCVAVNIDTDMFGTFSGEVERTEGVRATLRKKIDAAIEVQKNARLFLASEGSFVPHPIVGFLQTDLESLLLFDRKLGVEIYAEYLCLEPVHGEKKFGPRENFRDFLAQLKFPDHGVIVHPENSLVPIFKGLHTEHAVSQAMLDCFAVSATGNVVISTDLRACHNPTRQRAILKAGERLIEKLKSLCPDCGLPGFAISRGIPGLPCEICGEASSAAAKVLWECVKCPYSVERPRPDGETHVKVDECEFCNP